MKKTPISLLEQLRASDPQAAWERFVQLYTPLLFRASFPDRCRRPGRPGESQHPEWQRWYRQRRRHFERERHLSRECRCFTYTLVVQGLVNGNTPNTFTTHPNIAPKLSTVPATSQPGHYTITVSSAYDPNYAISYAPGMFTINPARLIIAAVSESINIGDPLPALLVSYTGLVNGDTRAVFTTLPDTPAMVSTTAKETSPIGTYVIEVSGAYDPDYAITYVYGTLSIMPLGKGRRLGPG